MDIQVVLVQMEHLAARKTGNPANIIVRGGATGYLRVLRMFALTLFTAVSLGGCIVSNPQQPRLTAGREIVNVFGSRENALQQPWVLRSVFGKCRPFELTANQKIALMDAIKDCYVWRNSDGGGGGCAAPGLYHLYVSPGRGRFDYDGPEFSMYLSEEGFLIGYMYPTPNDIVVVYDVIRAIFQGDDELIDAYINEGIDTDHENSTPEKTP